MTLKRGEVTYITPLATIGVHSIVVLGYLREGGRLSPV